MVKGRKIGCRCETVAANTAPVAPTKSVDGDRGNGLTLVEVKLSSNTHRSRKCSFNLAVAVWCSIVSRGNNREEGVGKRLL